MTIGVEVLSSLTPVKSREYDLGDIDYSKSLLDRQLWSYQTICTSHVNLFNAMFGAGRESNMSFFQLCNSVVILDEIQSYNNNIWREIIEFLYKYSELLNIKFIIISATLPDLEKLVGFDKNKFIRLIDSRDQYFRSKELSERVEVGTFLINIDVSYPLLLDKVKEEVEKRNGLLRLDEPCEKAIHSINFKYFVLRIAVRCMYEMK